MLLISADPSLDSITERLVLATLLLAIATVGLATFQFWSVRLQRRELKVVERQLEMDRQQIEITREQLRPRLELRYPLWAAPGQLPTTNVEYVSGSEVVSDPRVWFNTSDGRRFTKAPDTPSLSRPSQQVTMEELPTELEEKWSRYFSTPESNPALSEDQWWVAVTWQAADKQRYGWMYIQWTHNVERREFRPPPDTPEQPVKQASKIARIRETIRTKEP